MGGGRGSAYFNKRARIFCQEEGWTVCRKHLNGVRARMALFFALSSFHSYRLHISLQLLGILHMNGWVSVSGLVAFKRKTAHSGFLLAMKGTIFPNLFNFETQKGHPDSGVVPFWNVAWGNSALSESPSHARLTPGLIRSKIAARGKCFCFPLSTGLQFTLGCTVCFCDVKCDVKHNVCFNQPLK